MLPHLRALLLEFRAKSGYPIEALAEVVRTSTTRLTQDARYLEELRAEFRALMSATTSTHLLTELGLLSAETIAAGVTRRIGSRLMPAPARGPVLEAELSNLVVRTDAAMIAAIDRDDLAAWIDGLLDGTTHWTDRSRLASALVILATRVSGAGLDSRLCERMPDLEDWNSPFIELSRVIDRYAEAYVRNVHDPLAQDAQEAVERCLEQVLRFREQKHTLGTTLHLSSASLRMLQQLRRLHLLVSCSDPTRRAASVAELVHTVAAEIGRKWPTLHFLHEKLELVAYLTVGHAAQKGDKYVVRNANEYWSFWRKSLLGGMIVAVFAMLKIHLAHGDIAIVPQAVIYGFNYALCFVLIYVFGGTLATKQPALTASRLAGSLEEGPEHESFPELVRAIWRSQFVSFLGNIGGAAACSLLFALIFAAVTGEPWIDATEANTLALKMHPLQSGALWYAAIAGVMLSAAGFIAGFIDNAVVFHRVADRVRSAQGVFRILGPRICGWLARRVEKHAGSMSGNIVLGFMLGSAGAVGIMLGLPFDIRHVAFSSGHGALALMYGDGMLTPTSVATILVAIAAIGFVNFIVSFSLTLGVAIQARQLDGIDWRRGRQQVWALIRQNPLGFLLPMRAKETSVPRT